MKGEEGEKRKGEEEKREEKRGRRRGRGGGDGGGEGGGDEGGEEGKEETVWGGWGAVYIGKFRRNYRRPLIAVGAINFRR